MKNILITVSLSLLSAGCSKFTEVDLPQDQITRELVFKDEGLANSAMAGVYRSLESSGFLAGTSAGAPALLSAYTDELESYAPAGSDFSQSYNLTHSAVTASFKDLWTVSYNQIYNVNSIIEGLERSAQLSESFKLQLRGEALFVRALIHLQLSTAFGDIPYITTTSYTENSTVSREKQSVVYAKVKGDLLQAAIDLPPTLPRGSRVKASQMAAYAVLARLAYLENQWDDAVRYSNIVLFSIGYEMEESIDRTFLKDSSSAIWQLMPYDSTYNTNEGNFYILTTAPPATAALSPSLVNSFEDGDLRRDLWIGEVKDSDNKTYYYPFKYRQSSVTDATREYSVILRVEELYLIRAEAYIRQGQTILGLADLNQLRLRVNLRPVDGNNEDQLLTAVLNERRKELFTESGHRFNDLKHFGVLDQTMRAAKPNWKSNFKLWPLPESELLLNPHLKPQNEGY